METVADLAWRCAALFRKAGHPDSAAQVLERAGKAVEDRVPYTLNIIIFKFSIIFQVFRIFC